MHLPTAGQGPEHRPVIGASGWAEHAHHRQRQRGHFLPVVNSIAEPQASLLRDCPSSQGLKARRVGRIVVQELTIGQGQDLALPGEALNISRGRRDISEASIRIPEQ